MAVALMMGAAAWLMPVVAFADPMNPYNVQTLSFDMWCQERQQYDEERCDARQPGDEADYQAWRSTIERYELPYLKRVQEEDKLQRVIHHDVNGRPRTD
jgi:hypothetical protein